MSADRVARSVALEQAYVYDVYEQLNDNCNKCGSKPWPKVQEFLDGLESGSIVCDVGSGNGKYLNVNTSVYTIGGDKSTKLCEMTRTNRNNEIILLDNLSLPYRDESLDGVLSIAVIHHFATTERRVCALRELARVLRIGGRIIISVWAMEQNSRRFESQDVLVPVPWTQQHRRCNGTPTLHLRPGEGDVVVDNNAMVFGRAADHYRCSMMLDVGPARDCYNVHNYCSRKSPANKRKVQSTNRDNNTSPGSSNLSSPNETCYSFVRKAIQKLASGRPSSDGRSSRRRPWFLDSWSNCAKDVKVTTANGGNNREPRYDPDGCECCSGELDVQDLPIELRRVDDDDATDNKGTNAQLQMQRRLTLPASSSSHLWLPNSNNSKSQSISNMSERITTTAIIDVSVATANDVNCCSSASNSIKRLAKPKLVKQKQSICQDDTEEALDQHTDMLHVRKQRPVLKQRSLNEEQLMNSNARTLEKERLRHHLHKQTSLNDDLIYQRQNNQTRDYFFSSNAAARRLHLIKTGFANKLRTSTTNIEKVATGSFKNGFVKILQNWKPFDNISTIGLGQQQKDGNAAAADDLTRTSVAHINNTNEELSKQRDCADGCERHLYKEEGSDSSKDSSLQSDTSVDSEDSFASVIFIPKSTSISPTLSPGLTSPKILTCSAPNSPKIKQSSCPTSPRLRQMPLSIYPTLTKQLSSPKPNTKDALVMQQIDFSNDQMPLDNIKDTVERSKTSVSAKYSVQPIPKFNKTDPTNKTAPSHADGLFIKTSPIEDTSKYPIVRHASLYSGKHVVKPLPKLLSLELFNPETDDKDSDSSAVSSPDSIDSVVSVQHKKKLNLGHISLRLNASTTGTERSNTEQQQKKLIQAAVDVANSLDDAVEKVIRSNSIKYRATGDVNNSDVQYLMERSWFVPEPEPWNRDCQKHLTDFADRLTEKLQREISRYRSQIAHSREQHQSINLLLDVSSSDRIHQDPYIHRLSEELYDLSKLSAEIQKQNEYLATLMVSDEGLVVRNVCRECRKRKCKCVATSSCLKQISDKSLSSGNITTNTTTASSNNHHPNCRLQDCTVELHVTKRGLISTASVESYDSVDGGQNSSATSIFPLRQQSIESTDCPELSRGGGEHSNSSDSANKYSAYTGSTASLASCPEWKMTQRDPLATAQQRSNYTDGQRERPDKEAANSRSDTSQESLPSDGGTVGGEITYHRFYHVFRERELDQLIEKYVENLHIISSYYDRASWCIVAEKVHVWTI